MENEVLENIGKFGTEPGDIKQIILRKPSRNEVNKVEKIYIVYRKENDKEYVDIIDSGDPLKNRKDVVDLLKHFNLNDEDKGKDKKWFANRSGFC